MSTTARKARKRHRHDALWMASVGFDVTVPPKFQHPVKVGTPVAQRAVSMQQTDRIAQEVMSRLGLFSAIRKHLGIGKNGRGR
jgi:hypothetical protein